MSELVCLRRLKSPRPSSRYGWHFVCRSGGWFWRVADARKVAATEKLVRRSVCRLLLLHPSPQSPWFGLRLLSAHAESHVHSFCLCVDWTDECLFTWLVILVSAPDLAADRLRDRPLPDNVETRVKSVRFTFFFFLIWRTVLVSFKNLPSFFFSSFIYLICFLSTSLTFLSLLFITSLLFH